MIKQTAKRRVEAMLASSWRPRQRGRAVVLCYHSIHPTLPFASAAPGLFEQHLRWLRSYCEVVSLDELWKRAQEPAFDRPVVAITFDDGYADNYIHAFPLLEQQGLAATFFVTTGLIEADPEVVRTLGRLYQVDPCLVEGLSWPQIREMSLAGSQFGAHTRTHPNLTRIGPGRAAEEIRASKELLEAQLQEPVRAFAYPFGKPGLHFTAATIGILAELGFDHGVAIQYRGVRSSDSPLRLPRFAVTGDSVELLAAKVYGKLDVLGRWQEWAPARLARLVADDRSRMLEVQQP